MIKIIKSIILFLLCITVAVFSGCKTYKISTPIDAKHTTLSLSEQQHVINKYNNTIVFIDKISGIITGKMENWDVQYINDSGVVERNYGRLGSFFYGPSRGVNHDDLFSLNIGKTNLQQFQIGVINDAVWWYNQLNDTGDCYQKDHIKTKHDLFSQFQFDKIPQLLGWKKVIIDNGHQVSVYSILDQLVIMCRDVRNGLTFSSRSIHFENNKSMKLKYIILYNNNGTPIIKNEVSTFKKFKTYMLPHEFKLVPLEHNPNKVQHFTIKLSKYLFKKYRDSFFKKPSDHDQRFPCY